VDVEALTKFIGRSYYEVVQATGIMRIRIMSIH